MHDKLFIKGARVNNLKDITVEIPKNTLTVITGLSGSGKSSLAFDTIFAEGQRRYVESLSSYARQFLELQDKPDVDEIKGLAPTIAIDQRGISENPRSTVGTITEIADYLRLLFARIGHPRCLKCNVVLSKASSEEIVRRVSEEIAKASVRLFAPLVKQSIPDEGLLKRIGKAGFSEARLNGEVMPLQTLAQTGLPTEPCSLDIVVGVLGPQEIKSDAHHVRMQILTALDLGDGALYIEMMAEGRHPDPPTGGEGSHTSLKTRDEISRSARNDTVSKTLFFSRELTCQTCGATYPPLEPRNFSFNSPHGACTVCSGLGVESRVMPELVLANPRLTIAQGAIKPWARIGANQSSKLDLIAEVAKQRRFSLDVPVSELTQKAKDVVLYGTGEDIYEVRGQNVKFQGVIPELEEKYRGTDSDYIRKEIEAYMRQEICSGCHGARLRPESLAVSLLGKNIAEIGTMSVEDAILFFSRTASGSKADSERISSHPLAIRSALREEETTIAAPIIKEIIVRLTNLKNAGLGYLSLDRTSTTLSGGEAQRVRLAVQLSTTLSGVIYVLDEPTVGLHERDTGMLLQILDRLKGLGNTVIVVEHDREVMQKADYLIDMGPGAGERGGEVVAAGTPATVMKFKGSLTGAYLQGKKIIAAPSKTRRGNGKSLLIKGATAFNLKNVDVKIPLGAFVCVTGVSGSGKSTLILEILAKSLSHSLYGSYELPEAHKEIVGKNHIDKVISVDQTPIGRTPRSNPATYTGIFTIIRDLYTEIPEAKLKGFDAGTFSFNVRGGRCEACTGEGYIKIPMQFMSETYVVCPECHGKRYRPEALEIYFHGKNIADVLGMSVLEAKDFFRDIPLLFEKLQVLDDVGLGYIKLGQPAPTLSGGEAQRVKLATELSRRATGKTLYILDEPTTGLHFEDIAHLLGVLQRLVDKGNTVLVIEHNMDVIKCADWVIDMGPEGGDKGGYVVAEGTPKDICKVKKSYTGQYLKKVLKA